MSVEAENTRRRFRLPLRKFGLAAGGVLGGLVALDLIGFIATVYFGSELLDAAKAAAVSELLRQ